MRNKWFVLGLSAAVVLCAIGAIRAYMGEVPMLAILPGVLGLALLIVTIRTAMAPSFSGAGQARWNNTAQPGVNAWMQRSADRKTESETPTKSAGKS